MLYNNSYDNTIADDSSNNNNDSTDSGINNTNGGSTNNDKKQNKNNTIAVSARTIETVTTKNKKDGTSTKSAKGSDATKQKTV